jgi:hypothetical protein
VTPSVNNENPQNYFNYFTEIEEHFQRARGTSLFLLSPLDWALIESWRTSGVPLAAVLRGIDAAFEKWRARRKRAQMVNSLAYCAQAVMLEAQRSADAGQQPASAPLSSPFPIEEVQGFISRNEESIRSTGITEYQSVADSLRQISTDLETQNPDLEKLEQRLTVLEQKLVALARGRQSEDKAFKMREELDSYLRPWRSKMTAQQIAMLELQFLERATLESEGLPRLSLFYLA